MPLPGGEWGGTSTPEATQVGRHLEGTKPGTREGDEDEGVRGREEARRIRSEGKGKEKGDTRMKETTEEREIRETNETRG